MENSTQFLCNMENSTRFPYNVEKSAKFSLQHGKIFYATNDIFLEKMPVAWIKKVVSQWLPSVLLSAENEPSVDFLANSPTIKTKEKTECSEICTMKAPSTKIIFSI